tara:strand:+ start:386 stop:598 length:213 start_codon:yes stop_codon:yes gene_type:complete
MSHFSNDIIADNIISDVADLNKLQVMNRLSNANLKKVAAYVGDGDIVDYAKDVLMDQMFDNAVNMPGPHG